MTWPSWIELVLLWLGVFRVTRLVAYDDLTIPLRRWVTGMGDEEHKQWAYVIDHAKEIDDDVWSMERDATRPFDPVPPREALRLVLAEAVEQATGSAELPPLVAASPWPPVGPLRYYASKLIRCAWCSGFWISLLAGVAWGGFSGNWVEGFLIAWPLSAAVGLTAKTLDS